MSASTALHKNCRVQAGDQSVFKMSRHISPVEKLTFGWKIFVQKLTFGGETGYATVHCIASLYFPPAYGESLGPVTTASQFSMVSPVISI
mmetsp:Transcript_9716/g.13645  ORF Transcript_9716/g.13645 Transcript_9716/m.13645 type:complete len:90 (+) Transcript_9716:212-481(+)